MSSDAPQGVVDTSSSAEATVVKASSAPGDETPEVDNVAPAIDDFQRNIREDQVRNAVAFLSHPKVRSSPLSSKKSFLERKGLTASEIEEAFRRVPDTPQFTPSVQQPATSSGPASQHLAPIPAGISPPAKPFQTDAQLQPVPVLQQQVSQRPGVRWTQLVLGAAIIAAGTYAVQNLLWPYARRWYAEFTATRRNEVDKANDPAEIAALIAKAIESQTAELRAAVDSMKDTVRQLQAGQGGVTLPELRQELLNLAATISEASASNRPNGTLTHPYDRYSPEPKFLPGGDRTRNNTSTSFRQNTSGSRTPFDSFDNRVGYLQQERGQRIPYPDPQTRDSPSPVYSEPRTAAEYAATRASLGHGYKPQEEPYTATAPSGPDQAPRPPSYMEVLEMLEKGQTPPGIRTDINDRPPNPQQGPTESRFQPRPKPWERVQQQQQQSPVLTMPSYKSTLPTPFEAAQNRPNQLEPVHVVDDVAANGTNHDTPAGEPEHGVNDKADSSTAPPAVAPPAAHYIKAHSTEGFDAADHMAGPQTAGSSEWKLPPLPQPSLPRNAADTVQPGAS